MKILVSNGFGAGWSSWASEKQFEIATYQPVIDFLEGGGKGSDLDEDHPLIKKMCEDLELDSFYTGGASDLHTQFLPDETKFFIENYDGSEYVITSENFWN